MVKNEISEDKWRWGDPFGDDFNRHEGPHGDIIPFVDVCVYFFLQYIYTNTYFLLIIYTCLHIL